MYTLSARYNMSGRYFNFSPGLYVSWQTLYPAELLSIDEGAEQASYEETEDKLLILCDTEAV